MPTSCSLSFSVILKILTLKGRKCQEEAPGKHHSCHVHNGRNSQAKCNSGYILKVEQIGFSDGLDMKCEGNIRFKNGSKDFGLRI